MSIKTASTATWRIYWHQKLVEMIHAMQYFSPSTFFRVSKWFRRHRGLIKLGFLWKLFNLTLICIRTFLERISGIMSHKTKGFDISGALWGLQVQISSIAMQSKICRSCIFIDSKILVLINLLDPYIKYLDVKAHNLVWFWGFGRIKEQNFRCY